MFDVDVEFLPPSAWVCCARHIVQAFLHVRSRKHINTLSMRSSLVLLFCPDALYFV